MWRCFVLLSEEIQFLSLGFPFLARWKFYCVRFRLFVAGNVFKVVFLTFLFFGYFCSVEACAV